MAREDIVRIIAERIMSKGLNPKTGQVYVLDDIKDEGYRKDVEEYIRNATKNR